jgi:hypothetical protein
MKESTENIKTENQSNQLIYLGVIAQKEENI